MTLSGDKPLESDLYKNYFEDKFKTDECHLEGGILKSRVNLSNSEKSYQVVSSSHIDKYGNYKIYIHDKGNNMMAIPAIFEFLNHHECFEPTPKNPVLHIDD